MMSVQVDMFFPLLVQVTVKKFHYQYFWCNTLHVSMWWYISCHHSCKDFLLFLSTAQVWCTVGLYTLCRHTSWAVFIINCQITMLLFSSCRTVVLLSEEHFFVGYTFRVFVITIYVYQRVFWQMFTFVFSSIKLFAKHQFVEVMF